MNRRSYKIDTETLRRLRLHKGWSQEQLASESGISKKTIERWEKGLTGFAGSIKKVADALGVQLDQLIILELSARESLIKHVEDMWIKGVLAHSLRDLDPIDLTLRIDSTPDGVSSDTHMTSMGGLRDVFEQSGGSLLICGAKGAGKTTVLLSLLKVLLSLAREEHGRPIPAVFNLASWRSTHRSLTNWLADELSKRYGISSNLGRMWLENGQILPLLDDLDQVSRQARADCIQAIDRFRAEQAHLPHPVSLVVCCRPDDLDNSLAQLQFQSRMSIQPVSQTQIETYLQQASPDLVRMRRAFEANEALWQWVDTPLVLNALPFMDTVSLPPLRQTPLSQGTDRPETLPEIFLASGIESQLEQFALSSRYTKSDASRWLTWLAQALRQNDQSILHVEWMQPEWLSSTLHRKLAIIGALLISGMAVGIGLGVGMQLALQQSYVLFISMGFGFFGPFMFGALEIGTEIRPVETLRWSWSSVRRISTRRWIGAGFQVLLIGTFGLFVVHSMFVVLIACFSGLAFLASDISGRTVPTRLIPNQGFHRSVRNGLISGVVGGSLVGIGMAFAVEGLIAAVLGFVFGLVLGLLNGGHMGIQHVVLRTLLWRYHFAPLHYIRFLEDAVQHGLLRKVGGGYIFAHPSFGDYFVSKVLEPPRDG